MSNSAIIVDKYDSTDFATGCDLFVSGKMCFIILASYLFPEELLKNKLDNLKATISKYDIFENKVSPLVCIMTSGITHDRVIGQLMENNYYDYNKNSVIVFRQKEVVCYDKNMNIIFNGNKYRLEPNGYGGVYDALYENKLLDLFGELGITYLHVCNMENCVDKFDNMQFYGMMSNHDLECCCETIFHAHSDTFKYFHFENQKLYVVNSAELKYIDIGVYCFSVAFLRKVHGYPRTSHLVKNKNDVYVNELFIQDIFMHSGVDKTKLLVVDDL